MSDEAEADDSGEDERRDGDILGDVKESGGRKRRNSIYDDIPYERQWELDPETPAFNVVRPVSVPVTTFLFQPGTQHAQFRQSAQTHTDWINDILLCNYNQTGRSTPLERPYAIDTT